MPADWDSSTSEAAVDTASISETSTATDDSGWDTYPDSASSAAGNTPEIAHLNQGNPDSPNGWGDYDPAGYDHYDDQDGWGDDHGETPGSGGDEPDPWGDTYPDAAYPADSSNDTRRADTHETLQPDPPAADSGTDNGQPDQTPAHAADSEHPPTPEQQRISTLEAKNADTEQKLADTQQQLSDTQNQIADLKASFEQMLADRGRQPDRTDVSDSGSEKPDTAQDQLGAQDAASAKRDAAIGTVEDTAKSADPVDAEPHGWRKAASAENIGIAGSLVGAADQVAQFAAHPALEGTVGLAAMGLGLAALGVAKFEKMRKKKGDGKA